MTKKTKAPAPLPNVTLFVSVSDATHRGLGVVAARAGMARLSLYRVAIEYALSDPKFEGYVLEMMRAYRRKPKK